jgi:16S rRNA processing protein RimM
MSKEAKRVLLGRIVTVHGIRGEVVIDSYTAAPEDIGAYGPLQTKDGAREFVVKTARATPKGGVVARLAGIDDRNAAEALRGTELYALRDQFPPAEEGEYYYEDLAGLRAEDEAGNVIGKVLAVQNYGAGDLLEVRLTGQQVTELIPFVDAYVPVVDIAGGRVVVIMPEMTGEEADESGDDEPT